jgi:hypothetical protein
LDVLPAIPVKTRSQKEDRREEEKGRSNSKSEKKEEVKFEVEPEKKRNVFTSSFSSAKQQRNIHQKQKTKLRLNFSVRILESDRGKFLIHYLPLKALCYVLNGIDRKLQNLFLQRF